MQVALQVADVLRRPTLAQDAQEHGLEDVLGVPGIAGDAPGRPENPVVVRLEELGEVHCRIGRYRGSCHFVTCLIHGDWPWC